jgi:hypothetical protein
MKTLFIAVVILLSGCTGGLAVKMVELKENQQLLLQLRTVGGQALDPNDQRMKYEGRIRGEEQGS